MSAITHHIPEPMLAAYAAGTLPHAFSVVVAAHISLCDQCRTTFGAHNSVGGLVLEGTDSVGVSSDLKADLLAYMASYQKPAGPLDGPCVWFDHDTRQCKHHEHRPRVCRDFQVGSKDCLAWRDHYRDKILRT